MECMFIRLFALRVPKKPEEQLMAKIKSLFVTRLYHAPLCEHSPSVDVAELEATCLSIADDDEAGQDWCDEYDFPG